MVPSSFNRTGIAAAAAAPLPAAAGLPQLVFMDTHAPQRPAAEQFIARRFEAAYRARIGGHYPHLVAVQAATGAIAAAAGFRAASGTPLFLEQYLAEPVESAIARVAGQPVARAGVVEIGSLAADTPGVSMLMFAALARHLHGCGFHWAVVTATRPLRHLLHRRGFAFLEIAAADPARLADGGQAWGDYYTHAPVVIAGRIAAGMASLRAPVAREQRSDERLMADRAIAPFAPCRPGPAALEAVR